MIYLPMNKLTKNKYTKSFNLSVNYDKLKLTLIRRLPPTFGNDLRVIIFKRLNSAF